MNFLIIILNRIYFFLIKVKNQSPIFGAVTLVTVLISFSLLNIIGFYYAFKIEPFIINIPLFVLVSILIFIPLFFYTSKRKLMITEKSITFPNTKNIIVSMLFLFTLVSTIFLANINREKISQQSKKVKSIKPQKESLEGKIRKWFE